MYCGMLKGTYQAEATSNREKNYILRYLNLVSTKFSDFEYL